MKMAPDQLQQDTSVTTECRMAESSELQHEWNKEYPAWLISLASRDVGNEKKKGCMLGQIK